MNRLIALACVLLASVTVPAATQDYRPPAHTRPQPLIEGQSEADLAALADTGTSIERDRSVAYQLAEHRRLDRALTAIGTERPGTIDAYVVAVALDSDAVFGREAREAGRVLERRYAATGRTVVLAGSDGSAASTLPMGSPANFAAVLGRLGEAMGKEDVLVLYTTSHGAPFGIVYDDGDQGFGAISPTRLRAMLAEAGIGNRLVMISACYSGVFVPGLASPTSVVVTASSADRSSFGCQSDNDWTFFGDALINQAMRRPLPIATAAAAARQSIATWERKGKLEASRPQISIGRATAPWLAALEAHLPPATRPVGRPAIESLGAD